GGRRPVRDRPPRPGRSRPPALRISRAGHVSAGLRAHPVPCTMGPMAETSKEELFLVPHTHWDREWYEPFDRFRERLIQMMDMLIELADREPAFSHFHLDGQAALIDDYLEARPDREDAVGRLGEEGRISVGPWYTQRDEFLTSGESHIRNLEWGMGRARELGAASPVAGYLPEQFGHIGQMPQILRRGGLERAV